MFQRKYEYNKIYIRLGTKKGILIFFRMPLYYNKE